LVICGQEAALSGRRRRTSSATNGVGVYGLATNASATRILYQLCAGPLYVSARLTLPASLPRTVTRFTDYGKNYARTTQHDGEKESLRAVYAYLRKGFWHPSSPALLTTIDFNALPQDRPLALWQGNKLPSDLNDLIVILTPSFNGNVWYNKDIAKGPHGYAIRQGVSYRFSAPRFDASQWPNTAPANERRTSL